MNPARDGSIIYGTNILQYGVSHGVLSLKEDEPINKKETGGFLTSQPILSTVCLMALRPYVCCPIHFMWQVSWWRHQMETFSALLALCEGNSPVTSEFPWQRPVTQSFDVFFDLHLNKRWVNKWGASNLRCHRVHYDVTVMVAVVDGLVPVCASTPATIMIT